MKFARNVHINKQISDIINEQEKQCRAKNTTLWYTTYDMYSM